MPLVKYKETIEESIKDIQAVLSNNESLSNDKKKLRWASIRLLENNEGIVFSLAKKFNISNNSIDKVNKIRRDVNIKKSIEDDIVETLVRNAEEVAKNVVKKKDKYNEFHKKVDKLLVSKVTGIPIMILLLLVVLWITITLQIIHHNYYQTCLVILRFGWEVLAGSSIPAWISSVLMDGIYVTLAWVISVMLPPMAIFFPMFTLLEDLGYLPRIAFNLDKCFKKCCSCGKRSSNYVYGVRM